MIFKIKKIIILVGWTVDVQHLESTGTKIMMSGPVVRQLS